MIKNLFTVTYKCLILQTALIFASNLDTEIKLFIRPTLTNEDHRNLQPPPPPPPPPPPQQQNPPQNLQPINDELEVNIYATTASLNILDGAEDKKLPDNLNIGVNRGVTLAPLTTWLGLMPTCRLGWYVSKDLMKAIHPEPVQNYDWDKMRSNKYTCLDNHRTLMLIMANRLVTIQVSSQTINCTVDVYYHEFNSAHKLWLYSINEATGETKLLNSGDHVVNNSRRVVFSTTYKYKKLDANVYICLWRMTDMPLDANFECDGCKGYYYNKIGYTPESVEIMDLFQSGSMPALVTGIICGSLAVAILASLIAFAAKKYRKKAFQEKPSETESEETESE